MSQPLRFHRQATGAADLMVLLPGAYMTAADYEKAGFFSAVSQRQLKLDLLAVDLDLTAITDGSALPALQAEILGPAGSNTSASGWAAFRSAACLPCATTPTHLAASMGFACSPRIPAAD
jgi:hypothetical protein